MSKKPHAPKLANAACDLLRKLVECSNRHDEAFKEATIKDDHDVYSQRAKELGKEFRGLIKQAKSLLN